jgi:hypothetical protein
MRHGFVGTTVNAWASGGLGGIHNRISACPLSTHQKRLRRLGAGGVAERIR